MANKNAQPLFLLSTDTLSSYGLDLVFDVAKEAGYDGIDLALWKNFDSWNTSYVKKLVAKHDMPIKVVQISDNVNIKEMHKAIDICEAIGADTIAINPPKIFNLKAYTYLSDNLKKLRDEYPHIKFSIINPEDATLFALPMPKYRFANIVEIIKKHGSYLGLDVANLDADAFEDDFMRKLAQFVPYTSVVYFSDKTKLGKWHVLPGDGVLKLQAFLKKLKTTGYDRYFSTKLVLDKKDLADGDKVATILTQAREYYKKYFEEVKED